MSDVGPELSTLRTARMAMDEGLINHHDYDVVKSAFLKAHSIKAGLDAGFVEKDDYLEARRAFFESLRITANGPGAAATGKGISVARPAQPPAAPAAARAAAVPALNLATAGTGDTANGSPAAESSAALVQPAVQMNAYSSPRQAVPAAPPPSARGGASSVTANKKSMSGISVNQECIDLYNWVKAKKALRWITFKLDSSATQVVLDEQGEVGCTYADFLSVLPDVECRYAVYDYPYVNQDGESFSKLVFIAWSPSVSTIKNKMMYASTKDFLKGFLEGMSVEVQATELEDLSEEEVRSAVATTVARK